VTQDPVPKIKLMVNFKQPVENAELQISPLTKHWYLDPESGRSKLSFLDKITIFQI
jgi:hypothetical protein